MRFWSPSRFENRQKQKLTEPDGNIWLLGMFNYWGANVAFRQIKKKQHFVSRVSAHFVTALKDLNVENIEYLMTHLLTSGQHYASVNLSR